MGWFYCRKYNGLIRGILIFVVISAVYINKIKASNITNWLISKYYMGGINIDIVNGKTQISVSIFPFPKECQI
jgi:hypothetical protein